MKAKFGSSISARSIKNVLLIIFLAISPGVFAAAVKMSRSGICHDTYSEYYHQVKHFIAYDTLKQCLDNGGRLPKNYKEPGAALREADQEGRTYSALYDRKAWPHWIDADSDCQNTRAEVLNRFSSIPVKFRDGKACAVIAGLWLDPYTNKQWSKASDLDIDHIVPLKWAHGHGGSFWSVQQKRDFANDYENLLPVEDDVNQEKGAKSPDEWLPPNQAFRCEYVRRFDEIVIKYRLSYVAAEKRNIGKILENCGL